jgi:hypothetical protein
MQPGAALYLMGLTVALCGCATTVTWRQRQGLDYFVGKTSEGLLASLGAPTRTWSLMGSHYIAYDYDAKLLVPAEPGARDPNTGFRLRPWVDHRHCSTVFEVQQDRVIAWSLDGDSCRDAPFPRLDSVASAEMAKAGIEPAAQFPDEAFSGSSAVTAGVFNRN